MGCGTSKSVRSPSVSVQPIVQEEDDEAYWHLYVSWTDEEEQGLDRLLPQQTGSAAEAGDEAGTVAATATTGAVRLSFLQEFVRDCLPASEPDMPTWSVVLNVIVPATADVAGPYVKKEEAAPHTLPCGSRRPYYFVSHAWSRPLRETVSMLTHHFRGWDPKEVYVWIDILAVRQYNLAIEVQGGPDMAAVDAAIKNSAGVLLCIDESAIALRRTWCLYEAWLAATTPQPSTATDSRAAAAAPVSGGDAATTYYVAETMDATSATAGGDTSTAAAAEAAAGAQQTSPRGPSAAAAGPATSAGAGSGAGGEGQQGGGGVAGWFGLAGGSIGVTALYPRLLLPEERARLFCKIDIRNSRCKLKADQDALLAAARAWAGPGGLDRVNYVLRLALGLQPLVPDVTPDLHPGPVVKAPQLWDMSRLDDWLSLPESDANYAAMALYGPACTGKSFAAAAVATRLRSQGVPVAAHFCHMTDARTLDPITLLVSLALQLTQVPDIGPRLLRYYGEMLPVGLIADLMSYNGCAAAVEAAVEALLVQPLQRLLQPDIMDGGVASGGGASSGGGGGGRGLRDGGAPAAAAAAAAGGGGVSGVYNVGDQLLEEAEEAEGAGGGGLMGAKGAGRRSVRNPSIRVAAPKALVLIIDGVDQADGAVVGGSAPYDNQILQLIEEQLPKLPSFVRLVITSRPSPYIVARLADKVGPLELSPEALRPAKVFMRNLRLALASIDSTQTQRQRTANAMLLMARSHGSLLYVKLALSCLEMERQVATAAMAEDAERALAVSKSMARREGAAGGGDGGGDGTAPADGGGGGGDGGAGGGGGGGNSGVAAMSRSVSKRASPPRWKLDLADLPPTLHGLMERYLELRLRQLESPEQRHRAAKTLAVLVAAREPLTAAQLVAAVGVVATGGGGAGNKADTDAAAGGEGSRKFSWYESRRYGRSETSKRFRSFASRSRKTPVATPPQPPPQASQPPPAAEASLEAVAAAAAASTTAAAPPLATERFMTELVLKGFGMLVKMRGQQGHCTREAVLVHAVVGEWLQPCTRLLLSGTLLVDVMAAHRGLAGVCRDDVLACLQPQPQQPTQQSQQLPQEGQGQQDQSKQGVLQSQQQQQRGGSSAKLPPRGYSVRHLFLHVGLAALAATAADEGYGPSVGGAASIAAAAAAAAANAGSAVAKVNWPAVLEQLLQRLDLWTSIYMAGAGNAARWAVLALAAAPSYSNAVPTADPSSSESGLAVLLAEVRRWLLLHHTRLCWFPLAVVSSMATLPEDALLRTRALELAAGPDPWAPDVDPPPPDVTATASNIQQDEAQATAAASGPAEPQHLMLLSTGDRWSCCVQSLRTNVAARVLHAALHPAGRLLATVHDCDRGVLLWDLWGGRLLQTMDQSYGMGPNPTAAFFTHDGRRLICAARSVFVWEVSTGRLLMELRRLPPRTNKHRASAAGKGEARRESQQQLPPLVLAPLPGEPQQQPAEEEEEGQQEGAGGGEEGGDPDGPVTALAMSPEGGRVAAGHANGATRVWDLSSGKLLFVTFVSHHRPVTALAFSLPPLMATLVAAHGEGGSAAPRAGAPVGQDELGDVPTALIKADDLTIHVWKIQAGPPKELEVLKGHTARVNGLVFSTLDGNMVTGSADETVRTWWDDPKTPQSDYRQLFILGGAGKGAVHAVQFSPPPPPWMLPPPLLRSASSARALTPSLSRRALSRQATATAGRISAAPSAAGAVLGPAAAAAMTSGAAASAAGAPPKAGGTALDFSIGAYANLTAVSVGAHVAPVGTISPVELVRNPYSTAGLGDGSKDGLPLMSYSCGNGVVRLWSPRTQRKIGLLRGMAGPVTSLSYSADGRLLATADHSNPGVVRVWDVGGASGETPLDSSPVTGAGGLPLRHPVESMTLSPDGRRLAVVCADPSKESLRVYDVFNGKRLALMAPRGEGGHTGKINAAAWSWDSSRIATGSDDLTVRIWYAAPPAAPPGNPLAAAALIVAARMESRVQSPTASRSASVAGGALSAADEDTEAAGGNAGSPTAAPEAVKQPGCCQLVLTGHHRKVQCVAWAHNGKRLASGGYDQMVRIWDAATGEQVVLIYQVSWVSTLAFSPDDSRLVSGAAGKAVYMFNSTTGKQLAGHASSGHADEGGQEQGQAAGDKEVGPEESWMVALRFNPDGTLLACRDIHSCVTLWDVSGMRLRPLRALEGAFREALFCPNTGDLLLYEFTATGALVTYSIPDRALPLGRAVQRSVALTHPLLEFRGVASESALGHNAAVLLSADNRAFFFATGAHLAAVRQQTAVEELEGGGGGGMGWMAFGAGNQSVVVSRVPSPR
ncbi:hypothetical protein Agub_g4085 [Astrephomene gubernaculifera]|uniref:Nephrocystin 3-like N-terminal domain-containing protein n=1 Tax=Astrephomene gubernaculifera TaxID=47775 RepID=A0AAD3DK73_9CHLO|nr:hypothetical protein Agub_g4085 [Astrephomene gubernaculifera]